MLLSELIHNTVAQPHGVSLFCGIGERSREAGELWREMGEAGVRDRKQDVLLLVDNIFRHVQRPGPRCRA